MLTAKELCPVLARATGEPLSTVSNVSAALIAGDVIPRSEKRGPAPEKLDAKNVADFLIALSIDQPLRKKASMTRVYSALQGPDGERAGDMLARYIRSFANGARDFKTNEVTKEIVTALNAYHSRILIDARFPSITLIHETPTGLDETIYGPVRDPASSFVRVVRTNVIPGQLLFELSVALSNMKDE